MVTSDAYEALFGCNHLGGISGCQVALCIPFPLSAPCNAMLTMLVCATRWLFMHLYTFAYMSMHESWLLVCYPCFNIMKLWTFDPNLHLSLTDTISCLLSCLFAFSLVCMLSCSIACHVYHAHLLYASFMHFVSFPSIACLLVPCLCLCMYTHGVRTLGARHGLPSASKKGVDASM